MSETRVRKLNVVEVYAKLRETQPIFGDFVKEYMVYGANGDTPDGNSSYFIGDQDKVDWAYAVVKGDKYEFIRVLHNADNDYAEWDLVRKGTPMAAYAKSRLVVPIAGDCVQLSVTKYMIDIQEFGYPLDRQWVHSVINRGRRTFVRRFYNPIIDYALWDLVWN